VTRRRLALILASALFLTTAAIGVALAQGGELGGKLLTGGDVTIPEGETVDHDVYAFGGNITVDGTVHGDVVAAGGNVDLNGPVQGDVLAAGGQLNVTGPIAGDVRAAGGQIRITGDVTEDVMVSGGQLTIGGNVGQDLIASGGQLTLTGSVAGGATGSVGSYAKSGSVSGRDSITVTGNQGGVPAGAAASNPVLDAIRHFIVVVLVAIAGLWLLPRGMTAAEGWVRERPLPALGWGIAAFIGYFVLIIIVVLVAILGALILGALGFGTVLGLDLFGAFVVLAGVTLAFVIVVAFVADAIVGLALARVIGRSMGRGVSVASTWSVGRTGWSDLGLVALGIAVVVILASLPAVGTWIKLVVVLLALGAIWLTWQRRDLPSAAVEPAAVEPTSGPPTATT